VPIHPIFLDFRRRAAALAVMLMITGCRPGGDSVDPDPGIAETLAIDRAQTVGNLRYQLAFSIPPAQSDPISGRATVRFTLKDASKPLIFDFGEGEAAPSGLAVTVGGKPAGFRWVNGHIVVPPDVLTGGENAIDLTFTPADSPLNRNPDFLYTIFVPARAHLAFPCFDQPDLKARYTLSLTIPADWQAVANGRETGRDPSGDRVTLRYAETEPIPTYLFAFAAGKFQIETADRNGRTFRMFHRETDAAKVARNRDAIFDLHASALAWLEDYTAVPYRFGKFDFVAVPAFQFGGMEHPGAIFYNAPGLLLEESATENQMLGRASVIAHETAHMWFGDLVTMRWFNDVWMKEVFANFMAAKIVNPAFPRLNHELRFLTAHYPAAYAVERTQGTHAIRQELANLNEAGSLYGAIIYQKAPIVMRQLERLLGADSLRDGLRTYVQQFEFGNATWLDLVNVLDDRTPRDLASWSHVWVEEAGRPLIRTEWETNPEGRRQIAFLQRDPRTGRSLVWNQQMEVLMGTAGDARTVPLEMKGERTDVPDSLTPPEVDFVLPAGGGLAYGRFFLDDRSRAFLVDHVEELRDPVARGAVWISLWEELLGGVLDPPAFLTAALRALPREDTEQNVQLITSYLDDVFWRFVGNNARREFAPRLERTLRSGLARAGTVSLKSTYFNAFRAIATTPEGVAFLERVWRRREKIPGLPLAEPDEATLALELAVRSDSSARISSSRISAAPGLTAAAILEEQRGRFQNPDRKARFEFVMPALSSDSAVRDAFFESLADVRNRRREPWVIEGLQYLNHPIRAAESLQHLRPALDLLLDVQRTGDIFFPRNWMDAVLGGHSSREAVNIVRAFLDEHPDAEMLAAAAAEGQSSPARRAYPLRLRRIILQAADDLFRAPDIVIPGT
jgi:aminopeptidase N